VATRASFSTASRGRPPSQPGLQATQPRACTAFLRTRGTWSSSAAERAGGSGVGDVIQDLHAPPPDPRVRISQAIGERLERRIIELDRSKMGGRSASKPLPGFRLPPFHGEQLHDLPLSRHSCSLDPNVKGAVESSRATDSDLRRDHDAGTRTSRYS
jgi:hypothetical protein